MDSEHGGLDNQSLDSIWYERFREAGSFQAYAYFDGDPVYRSEQMRLFLAGDVKNPTLDYPLIDIDRFDRAESALLDLKRDVLNTEQNETVKQAYRWRINEKIAAGAVDEIVGEALYHFVSPGSERVKHKPQSIHGLVAEIRWPLLLSKAIPGPLSPQSH